MKEYLESILLESGTLTTQDIFIHILSSVILSLAIYFSYWITHIGTSYSKKFNISLVTLTVLTSTVMTVIGNNVALSLGMVGALSIVRFRTAIKDSRDTTYIFWAIVVGICAGVGDYLVAFTGSSIVFLVLLFLGRVRNENRMLLIVRGARSSCNDLEGAIFKQFKGKAILKVKNTTSNSVELIFEMSRSAYQLNYKSDISIVDQLYMIEGTEYVNIVAQSDEITG